MSRHGPVTLDPADYWQTLYPPETFARAAVTTIFPGTLRDGRQIALPIRVLPGDGNTAVASLIINQASFAVEDALMTDMAALLDPYAPEIIVGVPSLGLTLANGVARRRGHSRMVALGTTRKFWYDDALSEPSSSISSAGSPKLLYLDPRLRPLLAGRRVAVVDDVVSTGSSLGSVLRLLAKADVRPVVVVAAMLQSTRWRTSLAGLDRELCQHVHGAFTTPLLERTGSGIWTPIAPDPAG